MRGRVGVCLAVVLSSGACGDGTARDDPPALPPSGLAAVPLSTGRSALTWTDNTDGESGFQVERSTDAGASWTTALTAAAGATSAVDAGLEPAKTYHYRVRALFSWGSTSPSDVVPAAIPNAAWAAPPASPAALEPRWGAAAVYDAGHGRMLLTGGDSPSGFRSDVWALPLDQADLASAAWALVPTTGTPPDARASLVAIYDPIRRRMLQFGGWNTSGLSDELWSLDLPATGTASWSPLIVSGGPSPRMLASAVYDAANDRLIIFGGVTGAAGSAETWALQLSGTPAWSRLADGPRVLSEHAAVYDPDGLRMLVYGGGGDGTMNGAVYALSLPVGLPAAWTELVPEAASPSPRSSVSAVMDVPNRRMVVYGGYQGIGTPLDEVWALSLAGAPAWAAVAPSGTAPPARAFAPAVYDPAFERMVSVSGFDMDLWDFIDDLAWPLQF